MKQTPPLSLLSPTAESNMTFDGLRSPCPITTGSCSSVNRRRIRSTSCRTCTTSTSGGRSSAAASILSSIDSRKSHTIGCGASCEAGCCGGCASASRIECSAASRVAMRRGTSADAPWMSPSPSVSPSTKSQIRPSALRKRRPGPRPWSPATSSPKPRSGGVRRIFARGEKSLTTTEPVGAGMSTRYTQLQKPADISSTASGCAVIPASNRN
mmetsp:Transcript_69801/g.209670  ORF Transcript_69801/g.209670 Transcript_69801/m.209670 type:complete len:212 (+) Transcript_69801:199-834(+)